MGCNRESHQILCMSLELHLPFSAGLFPQRYLVSVLTVRFLKTLERFKASILSGLFDGLWELGF